MRRTGLVRFAAKTRDVVREEGRAAGRRRGCRPRGGQGWLWRVIVVFVVVVEDGRGGGGWAWVSWCWCSWLWW